MIPCQGTECGGNGEWHPVLHFRAPERYEPCPSIPVTAGLILCKKCMDACKVENVLGSTLRKIMMNLCKGMGLVPFDLARTTISRVRCAPDGKLDSLITSGNFPRSTKGT